MSKKARGRGTPANKVPAEEHPEQRENLAATLKAVAHITFSPAAASLLESTAAGSVVSPYIPKGTVEMDLLIQPDVQRLTIRQTGRSTSTIVFRSTGRHSFWDHQLAAFVDLPEPHTILQIQPPRHISVAEKDKGEVVLVELNITDVLGTTRHELEFAKRGDLQPFSQALFYLLHGGPRCHAVSNLPLHYLTRQGCLVGERVFIGGAKKPAVEMRLDGINVINVDHREFLPPSHFSPLGQKLRVSRKQQEQKRKTQTSKVAPKPQTGSSMSQDVLMTPPPSSGCFTSSQGGTITATIHQDLLDNLLQNPNSLLNSVASLLGTGAAAGAPPMTLDKTGKITLPWLAALGAIPKTAPGSGLFCFLREPRIPSTSPGGPSGGHGLLDRLAVNNLKNLLDGKTRLQLEFDAGILAGTMTAWGVSSATAASLNSANGDLWDPNLVTDDQRIEILEGYENMDLGVLGYGGVLTSLPSYTFALFRQPIFNISLTEINGLINFANLSGKPLVSSATIGASGDISITLDLPLIEVSALVSTSLSALGLIVVNSPLVICLFFAALCPLLEALTLLIDFVMNNLEEFDATCSGIRLTANIQWNFNSQTNQVDPFVTVSATPGSVSLTTISASAFPNLIASIFDTIVAATASEFSSIWIPGLVAPIGPALQKKLQDKGTLSLPASVMDLPAFSGGATSTPNAILTLQAQLTPLGSILRSPNVTQVDFSGNVSARLPLLHGIMRNALNPQPSPPTTPPTINVGTYVGLAVDQNALNFYVFKRWFKGDFSSVINDVSTIVSFAPSGAFNQQIDQIRVNPVVPPRLEIAVENIVDESSPLFIYFDDIRVCFGSITMPDKQFKSLWELSFNVKSAGTLNLGGPPALRLFLDTKNMVPSEIRAWEFVDPNRLNVMSTITPNDLWLPLVNALLPNLFSSFAYPVPPLPQPTNVLSGQWSWTRPLPAMQQEIMPALSTPSGIEPQDLYMEILALRRVLYLLPALRTQLLGFVDGSGAASVDSVLTLSTGTLWAPGTIFTNMLCRYAKSIIELASPGQLWDFLDFAGLDGVFP